MAAPGPPNTDPDAEFSVPCLDGCHGAAHQGVLRICRGGRVSAASEAAVREAIIVASQRSAPNEANERIAPSNPGYDRAEQAASRRARCGTCRTEPLASYSQPHRVRPGGHTATVAYQSTKAFLRSPYSDWAASTAGLDRPSGNTWQLETCTDQMPVDKKFDCLTTRLGLRSCRYPSICNS
jgi:hypothetical protein